MTKFNRSNYLTKDSVDKQTEVIMHSNDFAKYNFQYSYSFYTVKEKDIQRPDIISLIAYGRLDYWWFIMKFNGIDDVWNELYQGLQLKIPDLRDINAYMNKYIRN